MQDIFADPRASEILDIIVKETSVSRESLVRGATLEALGIPSLDVMLVLFAIETHFDIEIPVVAESAGAEFVTLDGLIGHVLTTLDRRTAKSHVA